MVLRILVVDDEEEIRRALTLLLGSAGYKVVTSSSADSALVELKKKDYNLIITDIFMPGGLDGITFCKKVKEKNEDQKIMILTVAYLGKKGEKAIENLNVVATIKKPFKNEHLLSEVEKALDSDIK